MTMRAQRIGTGQSLVEFAFGIPLLLLFLIAIVYFGRLFYIKQVLAVAAQEGARQAAHTPDLESSSVRELVCGFDAGGTCVNGNAAVAAVLGSAGLLKSGKTGNLPEGAQVRILPWDASAGESTPPGTVSVTINYPFNFLSNPFTGETGHVTEVNVATSANPSDPAIPFHDLILSETASAAQEVYQAR